MKPITWLLLFVTASALAAQTPADTNRAARWRQHREEFQRRRVARLRDKLGLTEEQATKLQATERRFGEQRHAILERQGRLVEALRGQLRPGVAANADSLRTLLDAREQNDGALAQLQRDERREMAGYLSPLQRARLELMRQQLARGRRFARMGRGWGKGPGGAGVAPPLVEVQERLTTAGVTRTISRGADSPCDAPCWRQPY